MPINIVHNSSSLANSIHITQPDSGQYYKYIYNSPIEFIKDVKYAIEFRLLSDVINPLDIYITKSNADDAFLYDSSFGKYVSNVESTLNTIEDKLYTITPIADGTGSLEFLFKEGSYYISDIRVSPYYSNVESPGLSVLTIPNPALNRKEEISIRSVFIDSTNSEITKGVTPTYSEYENFLGNNLVISRTDNLIEGSLFVGNSLYSGIEIAGVNSAFIRSIGYTGFTSASNGSGGPGFLIWSGSVLPESGDNYTGVGLDMVFDGTKYFRFRTNPADLDIRTDSIFIGNPTTNYISASGGILEISSSNFLLSSSGDVIVRGTMYADAGIIAGLFIKSSSIQNSPANSQSTILFGSASYYYNASNFDDRILETVKLIGGGSGPVLGITELIHDSDLYGNVGGPPTNPATVYYIDNPTYLNIDLSSVDAYGDICVNSNEGCLRLFIGSNTPDVIYTEYTDIYADSMLSISTGISFWLNAESITYGACNLTMQFLYDNDTVADTNIFSIMPIGGAKNDFEYMEFKKDVFVPTGATKFKFWFDFYRFQDPSEDYTSNYKLHYFTVTSERELLEISPSGLFYRANENKYVKLGRGHYEIKGTLIESDAMRVLNYIHIGSGSYSNGLVDIKQYQPLSSSGIVSTFNTSSVYQWVDVNGSYNVKSDGSFVFNSNSTTESYYNLRYNNTNILSIYSSSLSGYEKNIVEITGSIKVTGSAFVNDKLGGDTNSGEVLTFSKTVTSAVGMTSLPVITINPGGVVNIVGGAVRLYDNPNYAYFMQRYEMEDTTLYLSDQSVNYVVISGSAYSRPVYITSSNVNDINESNVIPVLTTYREGDDVAYIDWDSLGLGLPNKLHQRLVKTNRFAYESGMIIGIRGSEPLQYLTLTTGNAWIGVVRYTTPILDSETNAIRMYYHDTPTTWAYTTATEISVSPKYDDVSTGLVDIPDNEFGVFWVFKYIVDSGSTLQQSWAIVHGTTYYSDEALAKDSTMPTIPIFLSEMAILVGRVIVQKFSDDINKLEVESAFSADLSFGGGGSVTSHQELADLHGGTTNQYYHLTSLEYTGTGTDVFVRKTNPTLSGSVIVDGDFTATSISETSDRVYKENIVNLENQLDNVNKLSPKRFNFIGNDRNQIGLIAQEVQEVFPEFVKSDSKGRLSVEYSKLTGVLIKSLQEVNAKNDELETKINKLEKTLESVIKLLDI